MDFGKLLAGQPDTKPVEPREVWASLDKTHGYGRLWDVQGQVLSSWHQRRAQRDLVIKVNTGGGKTVIGLLMLTSLLNEGHGPALYVTPNKYLTQQVHAEAAKLGIATVNDPDDRRYLSGAAIAVINADKLMNGRSVFGATRSKTPCPIGSVVIDDVHAALATTRAQMSLTIPAGHPAFDELLAIFREDLHQQAPSELLAVEDRSFAALAQVPFWAWHKKIDRARNVFHKHADSNALFYQWPGIADVLELCRAVFTGREVTITPPCPPVRHITNFANADRRIYLTATLADDGVLVTDFDANPESVRTPITPITAGDIGERMILAPLEINPGLDPDEIRAAIAALADQHNVVVLVPSDRAVGAWAAFSPTVAAKDQIEHVVGQLRTQPHVGLVVMVNRYDGIDLPEDACRVLVLDGLPEAQTGEERLEARVLRHAGTQDRQVQRIEQGMGRAVRSNEDHCVVFLLGAHLSQLVATPETFARFSPATKAQLNLSRTVAEDLAAASLNEIMAVARQVLDRDPEWTRLSRQHLQNIPPPPGVVSEVAVARRRAFDAAVDGNHSRAGEILSVAADTSFSEGEAGALLEQNASYTDHIDPEQAQRILVAARLRNHMVQRPLSGVTHRRLSPSAEQARLATDLLTAKYRTSTALRLGLQALVNDLVYDQDDSLVEPFEEALRGVGEHLGFTAQRPDKEEGRGPDGLWSLGDYEYWVIEAKSAVGGTITKRDAGQLHQAMTWFGEEYHDASLKPRPIWFHHSGLLAHEATAPPDARVMTAEGLVRFKQALIGYATGLASTRWDTVDAVNSQLLSHRLRRSDLTNYLQPPKPAGK